MPVADRFWNNPFFVLALPVTATSAEVERGAQRLLAELSIGRESARSYATPLGPAVRTADLVRTAVVELRDPARRLAHECWARVGPSAPPPRPAPLLTPALSRQLFGAPAARAR